MTSSDTVLLAETLDKVLRENVQMRMGLAQALKLEPSAFLDISIPDIIQKFYDMALDLEIANGTIAMYRDRVGDLEDATTLKIAYQRMLKELSKRDR